MLGIGSGGYWEDKGDYLEDRLGRQMTKGDYYLSPPGAKPKSKPKGQPRLWSLYEVTANTILGFALALIGQVYIYNLYSITVTLEQNLVIGVFFVAISLARSYVLRRLFNWIRCHAR